MIKDVIIPYKEWKKINKNLIATEMYNMLIEELESLILANSKVRFNEYKQGNEEVFRYNEIGKEAINILGAYKNALKEQSNED